MQWLARIITNLVWRLFGYLSRDIVVSLEPKRRGKIGADSPVGTRSDGAVKK